MIANLLDTIIEKALYLDADTLCLRNIRDFYQIQLEEKILAACSDLEEQASCARIGLKNGRYFNAGVLLLNLKNGGKKISQISCFTIWRRIKIRAGAIRMH